MVETVMDIPDALRQQYADGRDAARECSTLRELGRCDDTRRPKHQADVIGVLQNR